MKKKVSYGLIVLLSGLTFSLSCKKDKSCEGCENSNKPPIAIAGPDQAFITAPDSIILNGSASSDPEGRILKYQWTLLTGPTTFLIFNNAKSAVTAVRNSLTGKLSIGIYEFELMVIASNGLSAKDTLIVVIDDRQTNNHPPIANAGPDQTITLPTNRVTLDGSASTDPDNNITSYLWTIISGASFINIFNPSAVKTDVTDLNEGVYQFELKVTDATGLVSKDTVWVTVLRGITTEITFADQVWVNQCYDPRPGVCCINSDAPSYGFYIEDTYNVLPDSASAFLGVWVKMDTSGVWEPVPRNCWSFPDPYPQTKFTYCLAPGGLSILAWYFCWESLAGRKADVKIRF